MAGLALLSVIGLLVFGPDPKSDVLPTILAVVQALGILGMATYLATGRFGAGELVLVPSKGRRAFLVLVVLLAFAAWAIVSIYAPRELYVIAWWPNLVALAIVLQFGPGRHRFRDTEQWITPLSSQDAKDVLVRTFDQPGLVTEASDSDLWVELGREWQGEWRHRDAAKHLKQQPHIHFVFDVVDEGTRITAFSKEMQLGMYDVLRLADEMSESGVAMARQATGQS
ncbi:hypothetical protein AB0P28_21005 [Pseudarthrobacter sp. NPDC089323]